MHKKIIIGNWKINKNLQETQLFINHFNELLKVNKDKINPNFIFGISTTTKQLSTLNQYVNKDFWIVAKNLHDKEQVQKITGDASLQNIKDSKANAVIIGHSEIKKLLNENDADINHKIIVALKNNLTPIICVGETLEEYKGNRSKEVIQKTITNFLKGVSNLDEIIIAYEPIWAIGTGKTASLEYANDMCAFIKTVTSNDTLVQYGGSVKPENIKNILEQSSIDGVLVGGASLNPETFIKLLTLNK